MSDFLFSVNIVLPLFMMIALGALIKLMGLANKEFSSKANDISFKVFLPLLLFYNIYSCDLSTSFDAKLLIYAAVGSTMTILISLVVVYLLEKDNPRRGTLMQALFRSNYLLFATPICAAIFPEEGAAIASIVSIVVIPIQNIGSVVILSIFGSKQKASVKSTLLSIVKNPFMIASALALVLLLTGIKLPQFIDKSLANVSALATPFALIILGTELDLSKLRGNIKPLVWGTLGKLVFMPLGLIGTAILFGFRGASYAVILTIYAAPTAVSSYVMAKGAGADHELAAQLVVSTSFFALFTVFLFVFFSKNLGFI